MIFLLLFAQQLRTAVNFEKSHKSWYHNNDYLSHDQYFMETSRTSSLRFEFYKFLLLIFKVMVISFYRDKLEILVFFFLFHSVRSLSAEMSSAKKSERNTQ